MKDPADRFVEAARGRNEPRGHMSAQGTVDYRALWGSPPTSEADEALDWASDLELVPAPSSADVIVALHPGAKPYKSRGGEHA